MRKVWLILAAVTVCSHTPPVGAASTAYWNWIAGRPLYDYYHGGGWCTTGPHFENRAHRTHVVILPKHCLSGAPAFASRWENADWFDGNQVAFGPAGYAGYDVAAIVTGPIAAPAPKSSQIWDYCNGGNCSSSGGGGSSNPNWAGSAKQIVGSRDTLTPGQYVCKSGYTSGTSCGTVQGTFAGWIAVPAYGFLYVSGVAVTGLSGCGATHGDSGAPMFTRDGDGVRIAGMVSGSYGPTYYAAPGNGCYPDWKPFTTGFVGFTIREIRHVFSESDLAPHG